MDINPNGWPEPAKHNRELCIVCDGRGMIVVLDKDEKENITTCPVCSGAGTV